MPRIVCNTFGLVFLKHIHKFNLEKVIFETWMISENWSKHCHKTSENYRGTILKNKLNQDELSKFLRLKTEVSALQNCMHLLYTITWQMSPLETKFSLALSDVLCLSFFHSSCIWNLILSVISVVHISEVIGHTILGEVVCAFVSLCVLPQRDFLTGWMTDAGGSRSGCLKRLSTMYKDKMRERDHP